MSVGGEDDKVVLRSVEYWDPSSNLWKQLACLPFAVRYVEPFEVFIVSKMKSITWVTKDV